MLILIKKNGFQTAGASPRPTARSRSGSDMPPACHSLRSCRFATRSGEAHLDIRFCMNICLGEGFTLPSWMHARFGFPKQSLPAAGGGPQRSDVDRGTRENKRRGCGGGGSHTDALLPRAGRKKPPLPVASFKFAVIPAASCRLFFIRAHIEYAPTDQLCICLV